MKTSTIFRNLKIKPLVFPGRTDSCYIREVSEEIRYSFSFFRTILVIYYCIKLQTLREFTKFSDFIKGWHSSYWIFTIK